MNPPLPVANRNPRAAYGFAAAKTVLPGGLAI
jgi:hypothetical protein